MAFATAVGVLATDPTPSLVGTVETLEAFIELQTGRDNVPALLRVVASHSTGETLKSKSKGARLLFSGPCMLAEDGNMPIIDGKALCPATEEQTFAELTVTGRTSGKVRNAEKSASLSIAESRNNKQPDGSFQEETDWYVIRGYGYLKERIEGMSKGALVTASGTFAPRTSKDNSSYFELTARSIKVHSKAKGNGAPANPPGIAGYSQADFDQAEPLMPTDW